MEVQPKQIVQTPRYMDLRHNVVGDALLAHLKKVHGAENATREQRTADGTIIDLAVREGDRYTYYELKIYSSPQACIREALGQLLEYSFWPGANKAERLVIVGKAKLDVPGKSYLDYLRKEFALPVEYRQFDMKTGCLVWVSSSMSSSSKETPEAPMTSIICSALLFVRDSTNPERRSTSSQKASCHVAIDGGWPFAFGIMQRHRVTQLASF
jgi:hypothetical protein